MYAMGIAGGWSLCGLFFDLLFTDLVVVQLDRPAMAESSSRSGGNDRKNTRAKEAVGNPL